MKTNSTTPTIKKVEMLSIMNFRKGGFVSLTSKTEVKMLKKGNPLNSSKVEKVSVASGYKIGCSYENLMNQALNRSEVENSWETEKPKGKHFVEGCAPFLLQSDTDKDTYYIRLYQPRKNFKATVTYLVDGMEATKEQIETIKSFLPKKSPISAKQAESGIETDEIRYDVRDFKTSSRSEERRVGKEC